MCTRITHYTITRGVRDTYITTYIRLDPRKSTNIEDIFPQDSNGPTPAGTMRVVKITIDALPVHW